MMKENFDADLYVDYIECNDENKEKITTGLYNHNYYEIIFGVSGNGKYLINYNTYVTEPGDLIIINKMDLCMATALEDRASERILIAFNDEFLKKLDMDFHVVSECFKFNHVKIPNKDKKYMRQLFTKILVEYNNSQKYSENLVQHYIYEVFPIF